MEPEKQPYEIKIGNLPIIVLRDTVIKFLSEDLEFATRDMPTQKSAISEEKIKELGVAVMSAFMEEIYEQREMYYEAVEMNQDFDCTSWNAQLVDDFNDQHIFPDAKYLRLAGIEGYSEDVFIEGSRWLDIWKAANQSVTDYYGYRRVIQELIFRPETSTIDLITKKSGDLNSL
jgi:hypothetical protein